MLDYMSDIVPVDKTTTKTVVRFAMDIIELIVNTSATFRVISYDIDGASIETQFVVLEGTAYSNWGNNDEYVVQYVANQLGYVIVP
jgi:hypothetical protein